jgi:hypothetical protein
VKLLAALYTDNPIRYDMLGTRDSLKTIQADDIDLALKLIRTNIQSITILGHRLSDTLIAKVVQTIESFNLSASKDRVSIIPYEDKTPAVNRLTDSVRAVINGDFSLAMMGVKLPPLQQVFTTPDEFKQVSLISHLAMHHVKPCIHGVLSQGARVYYARGRIEDALFFWDDHELIRQLRQFKATIIQTLQSYQRDFYNQTRAGLLYAMAKPSRMMKLCHAADALGYQLIDLFYIAETLEAKLLNQLVAELLETQGNASLVYTKSID